MSAMGNPVRVENPHGAVRGFDPFFTGVVARPEDEGSLQDIKEGAIVDVERVERFGKDMSADEFEAKYWLEMIKNGGTIISVGKAAHAIFFRLAVTAEKHGLDLSKVHFQPFARTDPYHTDDEVERGKKVFFFLKAINKFEFVLR